VLTPNKSITNCVS